MSERKKICTFHKKAVPLQSQRFINMKKVLFIAIMAAVSMVFTGCEKSEPCTCQQTPCSFHKMTVNVPVAASDWEFEDDRLKIYVPIKALTEEVYKFGDVSVYHEYHRGTKTAYQIPLPETLYTVLYKDNGDGTQSVDYQYQQHIDYIYGIGFVKIYITFSDFIYDEYVPEDMYFHVQLTY